MAENVAFGLCVGIKKTGDSPNNATKLIALVGLAELKHRYPQELSGGQQRVVARIAPQPKIVLLDEPLSNLDVQVRPRFTMKGEKF